MPDEYVVATFVVVFLLLYCYTKPVLNDSEGFRHGGWGGGHRWGGGGRWGAWRGGPWAGANIIVAPPAEPVYPYSYVVDYPNDYQLVYDELGNSRVVRIKRFY
jgi:hypothetical protein